METPDTKHLTLRGATWHLRANLNGKLVRRSLRTGDFQRARMMRDAIILESTVKDIARPVKQRPAPAAGNSEPPPLSPENANRIARHLWNRCRTRAKARKLEFTLMPEDVLTALNENNWRCALSGLSLDVNAVSLNSWAGPFRPSIDRISSRRGYSPTNIRIVCVMVNIALNEWGEEALMMMVAAISRHKNGTKNKDAGVADGVRTHDNWNHKPLAIAKSLKNKKAA